MPRIVILLLAATAAWGAGADRGRVAMDALGRQVRIEGVPRRIISLAPSNTEILFAVGAGPQVVAVTTFCNYPAEAAALPKVGGFAAATISLEAIVAQRPDLVLAGDEKQRTVVEAVERLGVPVLSLKARNFEEVFASMELVGTLAGRAEAASALVRAQRARVEAVARRAAAREEEGRPRVYWEVFDAPVMTAGPRSIVGQLIVLAGGKNIFADRVEEFPQVSEEAVVARRPQVILAPDMLESGLPLREKFRRRPGWTQLEAVRSGRIHVLSADLTSRPGPRLVAGLEQVEAALYPDSGNGMSPLGKERER